MCLETKVFELHREGLRHFPDALVRVKCPFHHSCVFQGAIDSPSCMSCNVAYGLTTINLIDNS